MSNPALVISNAGVDYITVTTPKLNLCERLWKLYQSLRESPIQDNFIESDWGFSGYRGKRCGGLEFGVRYDGAIMRMSSWQANVNWRKCYALAKACSRIDIQCTTYADELAHRRIERAFKQARDWSRKADNRATVKCIVGPTGGETVYIGSRSSNLFGRIYDKGLESGQAEDENHVRYEVEIKKDQAKQMADYLSGESDPLRSVVRQVSGFFKVRGVDSGLDASACVVRQPRIVTDVDKKLAWLRDAVGPFVRDRVAAGDISRVLEALGVDCDATTWTIRPDGPQPSEGKER